VKAVVVACNTASAWALPTLETRFNVPIFGVIFPGVRAALERSRTQRIGVVGTSATVRSQAYTNALLAQSDRVKAFAQACPLLVPLVEEGWLRHSVTRTVLETYLAPLRRHRIDTLILGCTHYPLLKPVVAKILGKGIALVDSAESCAKDMREQLGRAELLASGRRRAGTIQPFLTDETDRFGALAEKFLGVPTEPPLKIDLAPLGQG
jgi:glutamate racemase